MSNKIDSSSNNNNKRKLLLLALCAIVVIIGIGTSVVVYILAQNGSNNGISSKLNLDKIGYNTTTSSSWEEHNTTTSLTGETFYPNKEITLVAENTDIEFEKDAKVPTWTFNGTVPGPTFVCK